MLYDCGWVAKERRVPGSRNYCSSPGALGIVLQHSDKQRLGRRMLSSRSQRQLGSRHDERENISVRSRVTHFSLHTPSLSASSDCHPSSSCFSASTQRI